MDSIDKGMGVTDGSWREKRKRGRPRKYGLNAPIIHSVSPLPIAESPPPGYSSKFLLHPVKNRSLLAAGSVSAGGSQSRPLHGAVLENSGSVSAGGSQSQALHYPVSENLGNASGAENNLPVHFPDPKYKINMETVAITGRQDDRQMHWFSSVFADLSTAVDTANKKIKVLRNQVPDLAKQLQKWNDQKASWDEKKKELEKERDIAVGEKLDLEKKLEKAAKEAENAKASEKRAIDERRDLELKLEMASKQAECVEALTKKAINEAALKFVDEKRDLEEKLEKAVKQVEDAQASGKKAIYEAVASTTNCYKICLDNFVSSLGNGEGISLEDHVTMLVKAIPYDDKATADAAADLSGNEGGGDKKADAAMQLRMSQRAIKPNPKYVRHE